jgi:hypothetical protein
MLLVPAEPLERPVEFPEAMPAPANAGIVAM